MAFFRFKLPPPIVSFTLALIVVLGTFLRTTILTTRGYWYDEAFTGITVRQSWGEMFSVLIRDIHPPLYYVLLKLWALVGGDGAMGLRLFSVFFGVISIILGFMLVRLLVQKTWVPSILTALVLAINPFLTNYSQEARMYSLLGFWLLLGAICLVQAHRTQKKSWQLAYNICGALAFLTHYTGVIYWMCFLLYDLIIRWPSIHEQRLKEIGRWFIHSYSFLILAGIGWLPFFIMQMRTHGGLGWVPLRPFSDLPLSWHIFLFGAAVGESGIPPALGYRFGFLSVASVSIVLLSILLILFIRLFYPERNKKILLLGSMAFVPLLIIWIVQWAGLRLYVERFLMGSAIFTSLFLIVGLSELKQRIWLYLFSGIYIFLSLFGSKSWTYPPNAFSLISAEVQPRLPAATIVFTNPFDFIAGRFYIGEKYRPSLRLYNVNNPQEQFGSWALFRPEDQIMTLPNSNYILFTSEPKRFPFLHEIKRLENFSLMQP